MIVFDSELDAIEKEKKKKINSNMNFIVCSIGMNLSSDLELSQRFWPHIAA